MKSKKKPPLGDGVGFDMFGWKTREDRDNDLQSVVSELNNNSSTTIDGVFLDAQQYDDDDDDDDDNEDPLLISRRRRRRRRRIPRRYRLEIPQHGHNKQQQRRRRQRRIVVAAIAVVVVFCVLLSIYARQRRHNRSNTTPEEQQEASSSSSKGFVFPQHTCPPDVDDSSSQQHDDDDEEWIKIGRFWGFHLFDDFGSSIALNADGTVVVVGAPKYHQNNNNKERLGRVQAYRYDSQHKEWLPHGQALMGQHNGDQLGQSIALSGDGTILVVGVPQKTSSSPKQVMASSSNSGHVRVYRLVQPNKQHGATVVAEWVPLGNPIIPRGRDSISLVGYKVSCSYTCDTIALSGIQNLPREGHHHHAHNNNNNNDNNNIPRRFVQVYRLGEPTTTTSTTLLPPPNDNEEQQQVQQDWVQMGQTLDGIPAKMGLGHFGLSLSADGRHLAFAGRDTTPARVYTYHDHHQIWRREAPDLQLHHHPNDNDIDNNNGTTTTTTFQAVVTALSCNGNIFAAGGGGVLRNSVGPSPPVGVYQLQNTDPNNQEWIPILQADEVLNPQEQQQQQQQSSSSPIRFNHFAGSHAALSDNGRYLVLGDTTHSVNDQNIHAGQMRVLHHTSGGEWRLGTTVNGDMRNDGYGETVAISSDGTTVAVSSLRHISSNPNPMAYVDLFQRQQRQGA